MNSSSRKNINLLCLQNSPDKIKAFQKVDDNLNQINTHFVDSVEEGIKELGNNKYNFLLLSLNSTDSNKIKILRQFTKIKSDLPIIAIVNEDSDKIATKLIKEGAQDVLLKSQVNKHNLEKTIRHTFERFYSHSKFHDREEQLKDIITKNIDGMVVVNQDKEILYLNPAAEKLLAVKSSDVMGEKLGTFIETDELTEVNTINDQKEILTLQVKVFDAFWRNETVHVISFRDITELKKNQERVEHLNVLLKTISSVNHLIVNVKDKSLLLQQACELLTQSRGYSSAWIGVYDKEKRIERIYQAGLNKYSREIQDFLVGNNELTCLNLPKGLYGKVVILHKNELCSKCPLSTILKGEEHLAIELSHEKVGWGVLILSRPAYLNLDEQENKLLAEVAADLGFALHGIEMAEREKIFQEQLHLLNEAIKETVNAVVIMDNDGIIEWVNPAYTKLTNYSAEEAIGTKWDVVDADTNHGPKHEDIIQNLKKGKIWKGEIKRKNKNGNNIFEEVTITPIKNNAGKIHKYIAIKTDITGRKIAEEAIKDRDAQITSILENAKGYAIYRLEEGDDPLNPIVTNYSPSLLELTGLNENEILNYSNWFKYIHPDDQERVLTVATSEIKPSESIHISFRYIHPQNGIRWYDLRANSVGSKSEPSKVEYYSGVVIDITQEVVLQRKLQEEQELIDLLINNIPDTIYIKDNDLKFKRINQAQAKLLGLDNVEDAVGKTDADYFEDSVAQKCKDDDLKILQSGTVQISKEEKIINSKGMERWVTATKIPLKDSENKIIGIAGISRDISRLKENEQQLERALKISRDRENEVSALLEGAKTVLTSESFLKSAKAIFNLCKKTIGAKSGYIALLSETGQENEVLFLDSGGLPCTVDPNLPMPIRGLRELAYRNAEVVYDNDFMKSDWVKFMPGGHVELRNVMFSPLIIKDKVEGIIGLANKESNFNDDDARIARGFGGLVALALRNARNKEKLIENEEKFRNVFENATLGIYRTNLDGDILLANPAFLKMLGAHSMEELRKYNYEHFYKDKNDVKEFNRILNEEKVIHGFETELTTLDGNKIVIKESVKLFETNKGESVIEGVVEDITFAKQVQEELIRARDKAIAMEKVKSEFLAQMSHEIRTPLNSMLNALSFVEDEIKADAVGDMKDLFNIINSSGDRIVNTIQSILNMSELQAGTYEIAKTKFDLFRVIIDPAVEKYIDELVDRSIKLVVKKPELPIEPFLDEYSVSQIFRNILDNAVKYTKEGSIEIELEVKSKDLLISVRDTGIGIAEEYLENIFEPFSQEAHGYSRSYDGCGLGLALTKRYCELNDADINIISKKDSGTSVQIIFTNCIV